MPYLQICATKMPYLPIFATKMPYSHIFVSKIFGPYGKDLTPKKRVNLDKMDFATKLPMFGPLIINEGPSLARTDGRSGVSPS